MLFQVMKRKHAGQQQTVPHPMDTARSQRESDLCPKGSANLLLTAATCAETGKRQQAQRSRRRLRNSGGCCGHHT